ncbi:hypothetical protein OIU77_005190 [Salix suchowensis]|uniref:Uncharacterized protein n=1 Tax=Salix suchowensis TaxID=1278906 RepID=A0ABQ9ANJ6_9ROSI|nr:hypothetical protein OIU77_005190 [Salix suchowensis]
MMSFDAPDPSMFSLPFRALENPNKYKLKSRDNNSTVHPHKSSSETEVCSVNRNPADFTIPEAGNIGGFLLRKTIDDLQCHDCLTFQCCRCNLASRPSFCNIRICQKLYEDQIATSEIDINSGTKFPCTPGLVEFESLQLSYGSILGDDWAYSRKLKPDISKGHPFTPPMALGSSLDQEVGMEIGRRALTSTIIGHLLLEITKVFIKLAIVGCTSLL